jgi:hypothetical protein
MASYIVSNSALLSRRQLPAKGYIPLILATKIKPSKEVYYSPLLPVPSPIVSVNPPLSTV